MVVLATTLVLCWTHSVHAYTYDTVQKWKAPLVATGADGNPLGCESGCARWAQLGADGSSVNQTAANLLWRSRDAQVAAGNSCAQPGNSPFDVEAQVSGYAGSWCFCAHTGLASPVASYCQSPTDRSIPEQINLQLTGPSSATVAFVTFGGQNSSSVPVVEFGIDPTLNVTTKVTGVTHSYQSPGSSNGGGASHPTAHQPVRSYSMHFVSLQGLRERTTYYYRVRSMDEPPPPPAPPPVKSCVGWDCTVAQQGALCKKGSPGASDRDNRCCDKKWHRSNGPPGSPAPRCSEVDGGAEWSETFSFTSLYSSGVTKFAIFGDLGLYSDGNSNMGSMHDDVVAGKIDFFVHMGDHAYNLGSADDRRGDGYMNALQPLTTKVPWMPVVGNHEYYDSEYFHRYLNQTFGTQLGRGAISAGWCGHDLGCDTGPSLASRHPNLAQGQKITADSALGTLLARQIHHASKTGAVPSHTSRYYSNDVGLAHLVALDLMVYEPTGAFGEVQYRAAQLAWLEEDLKAVDRAQTPWVFLTAHHALYCTSITMGVTATHPAGPRDGKRNGTDAKPLHESQANLPLPPGKSYRGCIGTGEDFIEAARAELEPLMLKYGVDLYFAGHEHNYETTFPISNCSMGSSGCYIGKDHFEPKAPIHTVCGNGGVGGGDNFGDNWAPWTRKQLGADTPGECTGLTGPAQPPGQQGGCSAGYGRVTLHNYTHMTYEYVLNKNGSVWDSWTVYQPNHGAFPAVSGRKRA